MLSVLSSDLGLDVRRPLRSPNAQDIDGVAAVQLASDNGRLLELARDFQRRHAERGSGYPQDVFGIADALLRWHAAISEGNGLDPRTGASP